VYPRFPDGFHAGRHMSFLLFSFHAFSPEDFPGRTFFSEENRRLKSRFFLILKKIAGHFVREVVRIFDG